jgi:4'-phosphopantetheinyl transferase
VNSRCCPQISRIRQRYGRFARVVLQSRQERRGNQPCQYPVSTYPLEVREEGISIEYPSVCIKETLSGKGGIVDLWYYFHEQIDDAALLAAQEALMTLDEHARYRSYHFEHDRRMFVATRALVRTVLSRYAAVAPSEWRFLPGKYGKPRVAHPDVAPPIYFNLANTLGLVVCALSVAHESIGVDVERIDRKTEILDLADRYFSHSEVRALRALPSSERLRRFVAIWTLKESYIKARGLGLSLPLNLFSFFVDKGDIGVTFDEKLKGDATHWRFALLDYLPDHTIAVAAETGGAPLSLRTAHIVPLLGNGLQG